MSICVMLTCVIQNGLAIKYLFLFVSIISNKVCLYIIKLDTKIKTKYKLTGGSNIYIY